MSVGISTLTIYLKLIFLIDNPTNKKDMKALIITTLSIIIALFITKKIEISNAPKELPAIKGNWNEFIYKTINEEKTYFYDFQLIKSLQSITSIKASVEKIFKHDKISNIAFNWIKPSIIKKYNQRHMFQTKIIKSIFFYTFLNK